MYWPDVESRGATQLGTTRGPEWDGLEQALAASAREAARKQEAEEAELLREVREAEEREAAEIREAMRLVDEAMKRVRPTRTLGART